MSDSSSLPLATYRERLTQVTRTLELHRDRIAIDARWMLGGRFQQTVKLADLIAKPAELWVRQRMFRRAFTWSMLALATGVVVHTNWPGNLLGFAAYGVATVFAAMAIRSWPKVLFMRFPAKSGGPGIDIARKGPDAKRFDAFIEQVKHQIRKA